MVALKRAHAKRLTVAPFLAAAFLVCLLPFTLTPARPKLLRAEAAKQGSRGTDDAVSRFIKSLAKQNGTISKATRRSAWGLLTGVCAGFATKRVGQSAALIAGGTLIAAQALSHLGIVQVNWKKVEGLFTKFTDVDGDGDTDVDDALTAWQKAKHIMTSEMVPSAAGFSAGFAIGIVAL